MALRRPRSGSLGDLLRAQIGYADRAQELLLATDLGRVQLLRGRDSLPVFLFERLEFGLPGCFPSRHTLRIQLILVGVVIGPPAPASQALQYDLRPPVLLRSTPKSASAVMTPQRGQVLG
jgi:hypothetical protein